MTLREIFDSIKKENGDSVKYPHYLEAYQERFEHLRDKNIKDGGPVYWNRPAKCLTEQKDKIENLLQCLTTANS